MKKIKKILVFGGSFDPPHRGHLKLLAEGVKYIRPDVTYVFPAFHSPLKALPLTPPADRVKMAGLALAQLGAGKKIKLDLYETRQRGRSYTYRTLRRLKRLHPGAEIFLLAGSDCLPSFTRWKKWKEVLENSRLVIGERPGEKIGPGKKYPFNFKTLPGTFPLVSSTGLREVIIRAGKVPAGVPAKAVKFILKRGLYGTGIRKWLEGNLSKKRFIHTREVVSLAIKLAGRWGADPDAAALAGLLHDAGKGFGKGALAEYVRKNRLAVPLLGEILRHHPGMLHSFVSAHLAEKAFGINDKAILGAIRNHTLGSTRMSLLDKIIYVADISAADRSFPRAAEIRSLAFKNLDEALVLSARTKIEFLLAERRWIHPAGITAWNSFIKPRK